MLFFELRSFKNSPTISISDIIRLARKLKLSKLFTFWARYTQYKLSFYDRQYQFILNRKRRILKAWQDQVAFSKYDELKQTLALKFRIFKAKIKVFSQLKNYSKKRKKLKKQNKISQIHYQERLVRRCFVEWGNETRIVGLLREYLRSKRIRACFIAWSGTVEHKNRLAELFRTKVELKRKLSAFFVWKKIAVSGRSKHLKEVYAQKYCEFKRKKEVFEKLKSIRKTQKLARFLTQRNVYRTKVKYLRAWVLLRYERMVIEETRLHFESRKKFKIFTFLKEAAGLDGISQQKYQKIRQNAEVQLKSIGLRLWITSYRVSVRRRVIEASVQTRYNKKLLGKSMTGFSILFTKKQNLKSLFSYYCQKKNEMVFYAMRSLFQQRRIERGQRKVERAKTLRSVFQSWAIYAKTSKVTSLKVKCIQNERRLVLLRNSFHGLQMAVQRAEHLKFNQKIWDSKNHNLKKKRQIFSALNDYSIKAKSQRVLLSRILQRKAYSMKLSTFRTWLVFSEYEDEEHRLNSISEFLQKRFLVRRLLRTTLLKQKEDYITKTRNKRIAKNSILRWSQALKEARSQAYLKEAARVISLKHIFRKLIEYKEIQKRYKMAEYYSQCITLKKCFIRLEYNTRVSKSHRYGLEWLDRIILYLQVSRAIKRIKIAAN